MESNNDFRDCEANLLEEMEKEFQNHLEEFVDLMMLQKMIFRLHYVWQFQFW
jgi:hypothetical protein